MARCSGCSGDRCSCVIEAGAGTSVTGAGTITNPYVVSAEGGVGGTLPSGSIIMHASDVPPAGYLVADGRAVSRAVYSTLYNAIGVRFGAGDGSTTFNLPDLAGQFPFGADATHPLDGVKRGNETLTMVAANLPAHAHELAHTHSIAHDHAAFTSGADSPDHGHNGSTDNQGSHQHGYIAQATSPQTDNGAWNYYTGRVGSLTDPAGLHAHNVSVGGATARHYHAIDVPPYTGSSGAASPANSGSGVGLSGTPLNIMPPYLAVTFLIKT